MQETGLARIVSEDSANGANGLAQCAVRNNNVAPDAIEDVPAMHRLMASFDEKDEQIEVARDERLLLAGAHEDPTPGREDEITETIAGHGLRKAGRAYRIRRDGGVCRRRRRCNS